MAHEEMCSENMLLFLFYLFVEKKRKNILFHERLDWKMDGIWPDLT